MKTYVSPSSMAITSLIRKYERNNRKNISEKFPMLGTALHFDEFVSTKTLVTLRKILAAKEPTYTKEDYSHWFNKIRPFDVQVILTEFNVTDASMLDINSIQRYVRDHCKGFSEIEGLLM